MDVECKADELSLKSFFVGPQAENAKILTNEINLVLENWVDWRQTYYPNDGAAITEVDQNNPEFQKNIQKLRSETMALLDIFSKEIPKFSPRYLGHMFSETSLPAIIGHFVALLHNPNNVSKESSWVGVDVEKKAVQKLCQMVGYPEKSIGHFTSGGTLANFEAVLRSKNKVINALISNTNQSLEFNDACYLANNNRHPANEMGEIEFYKFIKLMYGIEFEGFSIVVPDSKHYSWTKAASFFGLGSKNLIKVNLNRFGQMCSLDLQKKIDNCLLHKKPIICLTSIFGSTELGTIDPIDEINDVLKKYKNQYGYNFWHHVDAAYGGFFACLKNNESLDANKQSAIEALKHSTSMTIDPHKLGYVPYASGVFLCNNPSDYYIHEVSAPYVNFEILKDLGPYTIEGSRSSTGAVALYMTAKCIGLNQLGYGKILERTILAANKFRSIVEKQQLPILFTDTVGTNIVCFAVATEGVRTLSNVNIATKKLLNKLIKTGASPNENIFFISKTSLSTNYDNLISHFCEKHNIKNDCNSLDLARLTIMNPFVDSKNSTANYISECINYIRSHI